MVHALRSDEGSPLRPSGARVTALSGALSLHVVVFAVLVAPIAEPLLVEMRERVVEAPMWVEIDRPVRPELARESVVEPVPVRPRTAPDLRVAIERPAPVFVEATEPAEAQPSAVVEPNDTAPVGPVAPASVRLATDLAPRPKYPSIALRRRLEGLVVRRVHVSAAGAPLEVHVERSSGHRVLDDTARRQVLERWRFVPAVRDGAPVPAIGLVPIEFRIHGG